MATNYSNKAPGNYIEETKDQAPISGTATAVAGFVGVTKKGRFGDYVVTNWKQFEEEYGGFVNNSYLAYALRGFFDNGGQYAHISRVVHYSQGKPTSTAANANISAGAEVAGIVEAKSHGSHGNTLSFRIESWDSTNKTFDFLLLDSGSLVETYRKITLATMEDIINPQSLYVSVAVVDETANLTNGTSNLATGDDGLSGLTSTDYIGDETSKNGVNSFSNVAINILAVPGITDAAVISGVETFCASRRIFPILDVPSGKTPTSALEFFMSTGYSGERGAFYYPWGFVNDPIGIGSSPRKLVPLSGHIAGAYARTDDTRGVFKAPAGEVDGKLLGVLSLEYIMDDVEQGPLNAAGLNALRVFPGVGNVIWGTRAANGGFVPVRRSADYVEDSIIQGTRWTAFEPNDTALYRKVTSYVSAFLRTYWRAGGLKGETEEEAFFVVCDSTTTTPDDVEAGRTYADVGIATQKPSEFMIFRVRVR